MQFCHFLHIIEILIYSIALSPSCFLCDVTPQEKKIIYVSKTAYIAKKSSALLGSTFKMNVSSVQIPTQSWISKTAGSKNIMYLGSWVSLYTVYVKGVQRVKSFIMKYRFFSYITYYFKTIEFYKWTMRLIPFHTTLIPILHSFRI